MCVSCDPRQFLMEERASARRCKFRGHRLNKRRCAGNLHRDARKSSEVGPEGLVAARKRVFLARNSHASVEKILLCHRHNEFTDELPNAHLPERRFKRELPDHVLS